MWPTSWPRICTDSEPGNTAVNRVLVTLCSGVTPNSPFKDFQSRGVTFSGLHMVYIFYGFSMIFLCFVWDAWGCYNTELNELRSTSVCFAFVQPFRVRHYGKLWKLLRMFNACSTHLPSFHLFSFPCMPWQSMAAPTAWPECCTHAACGMHDSLPVFSQVI